MRKALPIVVLAAALALPALALAAKVGTTRLSVSDGRGLVVLQGRGTVIGRVDRGTITVKDLTPSDLTEPLVFNCDDEVLRGSATVCTGDKLRFRMVGGGWRISIAGAGIDLSAAVSRGFVTFDGTLRKAGVYSVDGVDCRTDADLCTPIPTEVTTISLTPSATP